MSIDFQEIPYIRLTADQKKKALDILGQGTVLLKKWSKFFPAKKSRQFRNAVMNGSDNPAYDGVPAIPSEDLADFHSDLPVIRAIRYDRYADLDGRTVEQAILEGHSALARKHARMWSLDGDPVGLTIQDFQQEAYMQVIEAMYAWLPNSTADITTYIWRALRNRMSNVVNQANMLCPLTNSDLELVSRFEKIKRSMSTGMSVTFDQIIGELGLSKEEGKHLNALLARVSTETNLSDNDFGLQDVTTVGNDYTAHRTEIDNIENDDIVNQLSVEETLDQAGLSEFERELIEAAMNPYSGWQTDFAENHINPKTKLPYSKMRITQVLEIVRAKVARVLEHKEAA